MVESDNRCQKKKVWRITQSCIARETLTNVRDTAYNTIYTFHDRISATSAKGKTQNEAKLFHLSQDTTSPPFKKPEKSLCTHTQNFQIKIYVFIYLKKTLRCCCEHVIALCLSLPFSFLLLSVSLTVYKYGLMVFCLVLFIKGNTGAFTHPTRSTVPGILDGRNSLPPGI